MKRIAIIGGGISGLTAAYELELARKRGAEIDWHLYEATDRLGGIIETTRHSTPEGEWILEGGPDGWVSEKPWARELAIELGLEDQLIYSNDADRKTYILINGRLQAMPDRMRMFVPEDLSTLEGSPLFSTSAKQAYADEITRAEELKATAPDLDESVASFVRRHFGDEVLEKVAGPLLSGVFGGNVHKLSVRSVLAPFVAMEREHGSLVIALQRKASERGDKLSLPIFTSLERGVQSLIDTLMAQLPPDRIHLSLNTCVVEDAGYVVVAGKPDRTYLGFITTYKTRSDKAIAEGFDEILLATPNNVTQSFSGPMGLPFMDHLPAHSSSAILISLCWSEDAAKTFALPEGFGFLVPQGHSPRHSPLATHHFNTVISTEAKRSGETPVFAEASTNEQVSVPRILAATFTNQKFPRRTPPGARAIRVFFGSDSTEHFANTSDEEIARQAFAQLQTILGPLPEPDHTLTTVRRWPHSLPQYEVGHLDRMAQLDELVTRIPGLHLLGNSYRGVGLPDLIRDARATARKIVSAV